MKVLMNCLILGISIFFIGCSPKQDECKPQIKTQYKTVYLSQDIPEISKPPKALDYTVSYINYNNVTYYQLTLKDGEILKLNWKRYKAWAESNYKILQDLKENKNKEK